MEMEATGQPVTVQSAIDIPQSAKDFFLDEVVDVEKRTWPDELQASREKFASRLSIFPEGFFVIKIGDKAKGVSTSQITTYDPSKSPTWDELTDSGFLRSTHDKNGNALYVASVGVAWDGQGHGLGGKLVEAQKDLTRRLGLSYLFLGARIPGYDSYCKEHGEISAEKYVNLKRDDGQPVDPEMRFYSRCGLNPRKVIPNFEPDNESRDYGVTMVWENKL